jgi:hypothetical protein
MVQNRCSMIEFELRRETIGINAARFAFKNLSYNSSVTPVLIPVSRRTEAGSRTGVTLLRCDMECQWCKGNLVKEGEGVYRCENCFAEFVTQEEKDRQDSFFSRVLPPKETPKRFKKQPIPDGVRWAVWERDNFTCQHCGSRRNLTVDHIHPESKGGEMTMENAQTLCRTCNSRKGAR